MQSQSPTDLSIGVKIDQRPDEPRRARRTYLCGPCKRYKMKCNMELPCRLCVMAKREKECLLKPPNPPLEEEKTKIARRRLRNLRKRELEQLNNIDKPKAHDVVASTANATQNTTPVAHPGVSPHTSATPSNPTSASPHHSSPGHLLSYSLGPHPHLVPSAPLLALTSPLNPLAVSGDLSRLLLLSMLDAASLYLSQAPEVPIRVHTGLSIHHFAFMAAYVGECKRVAHSVPALTVLRWIKLAQTVLAPQVVHYFAHYYHWEHAGVHELIDVSAVLAAAHAMVRKLSGASESQAWCVDRYLLQCMALACLVMAEGDAIEGQAARALRWLDVATDVRELVAPYRLIGECLFLSQLVVLLKIAYVALDRMGDYARDFDAYLATVLAAPEFVEQIQNTEFSGADSDQFVACARVWLMIKLIETELAVLQPSALLQYKWASLQHTIVPDGSLIKRIYGLDFSAPLTDYLLFTVQLLALDEFFRRFENARLRRDVIYLYLTLYSNVSDKLFPCADSLCSVLAGPIDLPLVAHHSESVAAVNMWLFLLIRWLSLVRADSPHFPSLRFAQYLLTLMCLFNIFHDIDDRLQLPPGVMLDTILKSSHIMVVFQMYSALCHQAVFVAAMARFLRPDSHTHTLDLGYVFRVVLLAVDKTHSKFRASPFFSHMPVLSSVLQVIDILRAVAIDSLVVVVTPQHFVDVLRQRMPASLWLSFVQFVFGTDENLVNHILQLWRLGEFTTTNYNSPIPITALLLLSTDFLRQYEASYLPFWYNTNIVDGYMYHVVDGLV